jgi:hypothetical protein
MMRKKPSLVTPDTFANADKLRSVAVENYEKWTAAIDVKRNGMSSEVSIAESAIDDAITALREQKTALKEAYDKQSAEWDIRNLAIQSTHREKIAALEKHCVNLAPPKAINGTPMVDIVNVPVTVASDVKELRDALDAATLLLSSQKEVIAAADVRYKEMEARIALLTPPTMGAEEQASRLALRNANLANLENDDAGKGKGKGTETPAANPGLLY